MDSTTNLTSILSNIEHHERINFTWGKIIDVHIIGEYAFVEYHPWILDGCIVKTGQPSKEIQFHPYILGKDLSHSFNTLDEALAFCIAYKYDGCNTKAHRYFIVGIGEELSDEYKYCKKNNGGILDVTKKIRNNL